MTYHGGSIMQRVTAYAIYWTPNNQLNAAYQNLINQFLGDVGGTSYYNILTQYTQTGGAATQNVVTFGGSFVDSTTSYGGKGTVANPLLDTDIVAGLQSSRTQGIDGQSDLILARDDAHPFTVPPKW